MFSSRPLRIGLLSSSGDQPELIPIDSWFPLLSMTINKEVMCYAHNMPEIRDYNFRISYRNIEYKNNIEDIEHPFIRETLITNYKKIKSLNISCLASLPSGLGMGSSGAFAVAFTDLISRLEKNEILGSYDLFINSYLIEKKINKNIGFQDHLNAAFGGFNLYEVRFKNLNDLNNFRPEVRIRPIRLSFSSSNSLNQSFALLYDKSVPNKYRSNTLGINVRKDLWKKNELISRYKIIEKMINLLESENINLEAIGELIMNDSIKKKEIDGYKEILNTLYDLKYKGLIFGGRPIGSIGSRFALIVLDENKFENLTSLGYKIVRINIITKN
tara:strand:+ start:3073 stop:4059 length:987 start_codon:yes stop_codon:yes gene_type:complete